MTTYSCSSFDAEIENLTQEKWEPEDRRTINYLCKRIKYDESAKSCLAAIWKRMESTEDPLVLWLTISLLDICFLKGGELFQLQVVAQDFEGSYRRILKKNRDSPKNCNIILSLLKKWVEKDCINDPKLISIPHFYKKLLDEGHTFPSYTPMCKPWTFEDVFPIAYSTYMSIIQLGENHLKKVEIEKRSVGAWLLIPNIQKLIKTQLSSLEEECNYGAYKDFKDSSHVLYLKYVLNSLIERFETKMTTKYFKNMVKSEKSLKIAQERAELEDIYEEAIKLQKSLQARLNNRRN